MCEAEFYDKCCVWCGLIFYICVSCYRGQAYCCAECRRRGCQKRVRDARHRHQHHEYGRLDHRDRNRAYRRRRRERITSASSVMDLGSQKLAFSPQPISLSRPATPIDDIPAAPSQRANDVALPYGDTYAVQGKACITTTGLRSNIRANICCVLCGRLGSFIRLRQATRRSCSQRAKRGLAHPYQRAGPRAL